MDNTISTLVGEEAEQHAEEEYKCKWGRTTAAPNGSLYVIPDSARRVAKFNTVNKSMTHIGPDLGDDLVKWSTGAITDNGIIYSVPCNEHCGILKIDTNTDNVTELALDTNLLPEEGWFLWRSCAAALDGCIYFMPGSARRILKIDPNNNDTMSSVGDDLGLQGAKYLGTVIGIDGCVYGIPWNASVIVKYDPINDTTSSVGDELDRIRGQDFNRLGDGALGRDGCIYAATMKGRVLKIDTTNNSHCFVGNILVLDHDDNYGWGDAILGIDGCIYWPPWGATHILKYDPHSNLTSLVGNNFGTDQWRGGCLAPDGVNYCLPSDAKRILAIDALKEYVFSLKEKAKKYPEQLGCIFHPSDDIPHKTNFDRAVTKFGQKKVFEVLDECMPPADEICAASNLYPFLIAASYKDSCVSMIYHLLRQIPSFVNCMKDESNVTQSGKKRKQHSIS